VLIVYVWIQLSQKGGFKGKKKEVVPHNGLEFYLPSVDGKYAVAKATLLIPPKHVVDFQLETSKLRGVKAIDLAPFQASYSIKFTQPEVSRCLYSMS
jgi:hypothetical protein